MRVFFAQLAGNDPLLCHHTCIPHQRYAFLKKQPLTSTIVVQGVRHSGAVVRWVSAELTRIVAFGKFCCAEFRKEVAKF